MILTIFQAIAAIPQIANIVQSLVLQWLEFRQSLDQKEYDKKKAILHATIIALKQAKTDDEISKFSKLLYDLQKN